MKNELEIIIPARKADIGIEVNRILPYMKKRMVGPFIFLDEMGPALLKTQAESMDVRPHPHIGLSTLTYLFEGEILHRDSLGSEQLIVPGEVNWMTAGSGISHSEREPVYNRSLSRRIHGLQFWVVLPKEKEDIAPSFVHYKKQHIPEFKEGNLDIKLVAGNAFGRTSELNAYSPMIFMVMKGIDRGVFTFSGSSHEYALYVVSGEIKVGDQTFGTHQMVCFKIGSSIEAHYDKDTIFVLIGGEAFPEKRYIWWNLVSSDQEKIEKAKEMWRNGTFPMVPRETEKIPLPER